jgi:hypothetical protein
MNTIPSIPNKEAIAKAAPLAVSGLAGSEFWQEVEQHLAKLTPEAPKFEITPRPGTFAR